MLSRGEARVCVCFDSEWRLWEGYFCKTLAYAIPPQAIINKTKPCISLNYNDFNFSYKISSKFCLITS